MNRWQGALLVIALLDQGRDVCGLGILLGPDGCQLLPVPVFLQHENVFGVRGSGFGVRVWGFGGVHSLCALIFVQACGIQHEAVIVCKRVLAAAQASGFRHMGFRAVRDQTYGLSSSARSGHIGKPGGLGRRDGQ